MIGCKYKTKIGGILYDHCQKIGYWYSDLELDKKFWIGSGTWFCLYKRY